MEPVLLIPGAWQGQINEFDRTIRITSALTRIMAYNVYR
jgi:hypothetical protein